MPSPSHSPSLASSSTTVADPDPLESQQSKANLSRWRGFFGGAAVGEDALNHEYPGDGTDQSPFLVEFVQGDPQDPMAFSRSRKWTITLLQAIATLAATFVSSAYSGGVREVIRGFEISKEVATLGISLFVLGFAVGPLIWAPLSELYGRQRIFFVTYLALTAFNAEAAGAPTITALVTLRFFAGAFGASPLTNAGGVIADMFNESERGIATSIFAMAPFMGPAIGPIVGGFLSESQGWRWLQGLMAIFTGVLWIVIALTVPETYAPVLLRRRANELSKMTGRAYISKLDADRPPPRILHQFKTALVRPWVLLFKEPIVLLTSIYMAVIYGTLYMCFAAFPIVFQAGRGWSPGVGGLAFTGIAVGVLIATLGSIWDNKRFSRVVAENNGIASPEARLPPALLGAILLPIGLFWFAWTSSPSIHWVVPIIGSVFFAIGLVLVFLSLINYLVDSYVVFAASVLAANSILRSLFGAAFPLFTSYMYRNLGSQWAGSIPAFLALACVPFPFLFYKYGASVRMKCEFASEAAAVLEKMRTKHTITLEDEAMAEAESIWRERRHGSITRHESHPVNNDR
ncbi:putative MFS-type transporter [Neonectria ditissima]|uniref:Putative MFS-type transporter n=1 Tax=Neonectria ditissima TaxID=78410 RepID=A0A0P7APR8_9HYPO|nr:putative MFS-type transporter [Neonectria ditissima]